MRSSRISAAATLARRGLVVVGGLMHLGLARTAWTLGIDLDSVFHDGGLIRTRLLSTRPAIATGTRAATGTVLINVNPHLTTFTALATTPSAIGSAFGTMVRLGLKALRRTLAGTLSVPATTETALTRALSGAGVLVKFAELFNSNSWDFMELLPAARPTLRMSLEALASGAGVEAAAHAAAHAAGETALRPALRSAAEATLGSAVEALLKSLLDHLSTLGAEILPAAGTLLAELAAGSAQWLTFNLNSHLARSAAITGAPLAPARMALHLAAAGSGQGLTFNLNSHLARPAAVIRAPFSAAALGAFVVIVQLDDVLTLRLVGLGEGGGGQEA